MKKLIELVQLSESLKEKNNFFNSSDLTRRAKSKIQQLYEGIRSTEIKDDASAIKLLYGRRVKVSRTTYNSLKMRLFTRLKDSLLAINESKEFLNRSSQVHYSCIRNACIVQMLTMRSASISAQYLAKKYFELASTYQFSSEAAVFAQTISIWSAYNGNERDFEKYAELNLYWREVTLAEKEAYIYYHRVMSWYAAKWTLQLDKLPILSSYILIIEKWCKKYDTNELNEIHYRLLKVKAEIEQDYEEIIRLVSEIERYFKKNPIFFSRIVLGSFYTSALAANIWLEKLPEAFVCAEKCKELLTKDTNNWFYYQDYHFILACHSKSYELARSIFHQVVTHDRLTFIGSLHVEKWRLFEFYLRFIFKAELKETLLPPEVLNSTSARKSFSAFTKCIPTISKDLTGYGIAAVFAQILYLLQTHDYDALIVRDESLQTFRRKRLSKINYRLSVFAKLIHVMVGCEFDYERTQRKAATLLHNLTNVPPKYGSGSAESLEIIPLEDLWDMMMEELKGEKC